MTETETDDGGFAAVGPGLGGAAVTQRVPQAPPAAAAELEAVYDNRLGVTMTEIVKAERAG